MPSTTYTPIPSHGESTVDVAYNIALIPHYVAHYAPLYPSNRVQTAVEAATEEQFRESHFRTIMTYLKASGGLVSKVDELRK
jgi:hypothetical protein